MPTVPATLPLQLGLTAAGNLSATGSTFITPSPQLLGRFMPTQLSARDREPAALEPRAGEEQAGGGGNAILESPALLQLQLCARTINIDELLLGTAAHLARQELVALQHMLQATFTDLVRFTGLWADSSEGEGTWGTLSGLHIICLGGGLKCGLTASYAEVISLPCAYNDLNPHCGSDRAPALYQLDREE